MNFSPKAGRTPENAKTEAFQPRFSQQENRRGKNEKDKLNRLTLSYPEIMKKKSAKILSSYEVGREASGLLREVRLAIVVLSFGHSRFVSACVVQPVISRPGSPGWLLREVRLAIVVLSFGHSRFCPYARTGSSSLHSGGNLSILWARPVLSCLYSLFLSLRAIPLPWRGNPFPHS